MKSRIDQAAMDRIKSEYAQMIDDELPKLAEAMFAADSGAKYRGKLTVTLDWSSKPATETEPEEETVQIHAKLDTPKLSTDAEKVVWRDGQMTLL